MSSGNSMEDRLAAAFRAAAEKQQPKTEAVALPAGSSVPEQPLQVLLQISGEIRNGVPEIPVQLTSGENTIALHSTLELARDDVRVVIDLAAYRQLFVPIAAEVRRGVTAMTELRLITGELTSEIPAEVQYQPGAVTTVTLQIAATESTRLRKVLAQTFAPEILLLEDDKFLHDIVLELLATDYGVAGALNLAEAQESLQRYGRFRAGIFDGSLPDGKSLPFAEQILTKDPKFQILFLTGRIDSDDQDRVKAHFPPENRPDFAQKPVSESTLFTKIAALLKQNP